MSKCECTECGKVFPRGSEGDNEQLCLRCERELLISDLDDCEYEELDLMETAQARGEL